MNSGLFIPDWVFPPVSQNIEPEAVDNHVCLAPEQFEASLRELCYELAVANGCLESSPYAPIAASDSLIVGDCPASTSRRRIWWNFDNTTLATDSATMRSV